MMENETDVKVNLGWEQLKEVYGQAELPPSIDERIRHGIRRGRERRRRRFWYRIGGLNIAALLLVLLVTIRLSPAVAAYVGDLPILRYLSQRMNPDKGLEVAVKQGYMQHVGKSVKHDGVEFTVNDLIVDEARMIVFYTITEEVGYQSIQPGPEWFDEATGEKIEQGQQVGVVEAPKRNGNQTSGTMEVNWKEGADIPQKIGLTVSMDVQYPGKARFYPLDKEWKLRFTIEKNQVMPKRIIDINREVALDGQKVTFLQAVLLPTTIRVDFTIDPLNSKQIFAIEDLHLVDETGKEWKPLAAYDPKWRSYVHEALRPLDKYSIYFEGSLLTEPKSLDIIGSSIRALDKDKREILVDVDKKQLLKVPDDRVKLKSVNTYPLDVEVEFELAKPGSEVMPSMMNISRVRTWEETWLHLAGYGGCGGGDSINTLTQTLQCKHHLTEQWREYTTNPIIYRIYDWRYDKIHQPFRVKIM